MAVDKERREEGRGGEIACAYTYSKGVPFERFVAEESVYGSRTAA